MGDVVSLVEKVQEQFDEKKAAKMEQKILKIDLLLMILKQIKQIKKMGNLKDLLSMIPNY